MKNKILGQAAALDRSVNGYYVATFENNVVYSSDLVSWTTESFSGTNLQSIVFGDNELVAATTFFTRHSTDLITWTTPPIAPTITYIAYGNNRFVGIPRGSSSASYSTDGINWTNTNLPSFQYAWDIAYGEGLFVAIGDTDPHILYTTDGITWSIGNTPGFEAWKSLTYGEGKFVAVAPPVFGNAFFAYSTNGINWTTSGTTPTDDYWDSITYGDGKFVAVGDSVAGTSTDGISWSIYSMPLNEFWLAVTYGDGKFVAFLNNSSSFASSTDGATWTLGSLPVNTTSSTDAAYGVLDIRNDTTQYIVPNNTETLVSSIYVANNSSNSENYSIWVIPNSETKSDLYYLRKEVTIESKDFDIIETGISLSEGDQIITFGSSELVSINIFGTEK